MRTTHPLRLGQGKPALLALGAWTALSLAGCSDSTGPGGGVGTATISTHTSGEDPDEEGYVYLIRGDGEESPISGPIGPNDTAAVADIPNGNYTVTLDEVARNCTVVGGGDGTVPVSIPWNPTASFSVVCSRDEGELEVRAVTTGEDLDPDGYSLQIDDGEGRALPREGSIGPLALPSGEHSLSLQGVSENCTLRGENPRTVDLGFQESLLVTFEVECLATSGALDVTVETTGVDPDPDGYTLRVGDDIERSLDVDDSLQISPVPSGSLEVELAGLAENCRVAGENPRDVEVPFGGGSVSLAYHVECLSRFGDLEVRTRTSGEDLDSDGYKVRLDGDEVGSIAINGSLTLADVPSGEHEVRLTNLASNCSVVDGRDRRTVEVPLGGETATVEFDIECLPTGTLEVSVSTSGSDFDVDGYRIELNGRTSVHVEPNGTQVFSDLQPATHQVEILDVDVDCRVDGENPRSIEVPPGETVTLSFSVSCRALSGTLVFTSLRDGNREIYRMNVDGSGLQNLTSSGGVDHHAKVSSDGRKIVFHSGRNGGRQIFVMDSDGSNAVQVTSGDDSLHPAWSPDGSRIAFQGRRNGDWEVLVVNADGSGETNLTQSPGLDLQPVWSPDGSRILFQSERDGRSELYTMKPDGSDLRRLTDNPASDGRPAWSPDGSKICFSSFRTGDEEVWVMDADGTDARNLTHSPLSLDGRCWWSPDGRFITFTSNRGGNFDIYIMRASDGSGQRRLTFDAAKDEEATWFP